MEEIQDANILWLRPTKGDNISVGRERIAEHLERRGLSVTIQDSSGIDLIKAVKEAVSNDYEVIIGTTRVGLYIGYLLSKFLRIGFIADVADPIEQIQYLPAKIYAFFCWYETQVLKRSNQQVFFYQSSLDRAKKNGISGIKLHNGVDYEKFANPDRDSVSVSESILHRCGVDTNGLVTMYIGGLSHRYHIKEIIEAAEESPDWQFVFIGLGECEELINDAAERMDNVFFPGSFEYHLIPGFLSHATVGLCLVDAEQPLKVLEYGAASLPTIAIHGELADRFSNDELLFIRPNPKEISEALEKLSMDNSIRKQYGKNLRKCSKEYSWSDIAQTYFELINEVK